MRRPAGLLLLALATATAAPRPAAASEPAPNDEGRWADDSAVTLPSGRLEAGVLSSSAYGITDNLELRIHPIAAFFFPSASLKARWLHTGSVSFSSSHTLSYPTRLFDLVAREGTLGLLPPDQEVSATVLITNQLITTAAWAEGHWVTTQLGLVVASHRPLSEQPFDFPFLYQRLAATSTGWVPRALVMGTGRLTRGISYEVGVEGYLHLPNNTQALEAWTQAHMTLGWRHRISAGIRLSHAELPVGTRTHWLPSLDYRVRFDWGTQPNR